MNWLETLPDMEGVSFASTLAESDADTGKTTQYFEMFGHRGIWMDLDESVASGKARLCRVKARRDIGRAVREEVDVLDGEQFWLVFSHKMGVDDPYPGETAWQAWDSRYPGATPIWISSGDLEVVYPEGGSLEGPKP